MDFLMDPTTKGKISFFESYNYEKISGIEKKIKTEIGKQSIIH